MSLKLKISRPTRRVKCYVPGCRNRNALKISRRNDVNGNPLYMCEECLADAMNLLFNDEEKTPVIGGEKAPEDAEEIGESHTNETAQIISEDLAVEPTEYPQNAESEGIAIESAKTESESKTAINEEIGERTREKVAENAAAEGVDAPKRQRKTKEKQ